MKLGLVSKVTVALSPLVLTFAYLSSSDDHLIGALALGMLILGVFATLVLKWSVFGVFMTMTVVQWVQVGDMGVSTYLAAVALFIQSLNAVLSSKPKPLLFWTILFWIVIYNISVLVLKPYPIVKIWFFLYMEALMLFAWTRTIQWNASKIIGFVLAHGAFMVVYGVSEFLLTGNGRISGPTMISTAYAVQIAVLWTIWFVHGFLAENRNWLYLGIGSFLVFYCIILSGTRMGLLGMVFGVGLAIISRAMAMNTGRWVNKLAQGVVWIALGFTFILLVWQTIPSDLLIKKGLSTLLSGKLDASSMGRVGAWATALDTIPKHWVWGIGPGNFLQYNVDFLNQFSSMPMIDRVPRLGHAHNIYLIVLCEHGIIGFAMLGCVVIFCIAQLFRFIHRNATNPIGYALLCGGLVLAALGCLDAIPLIPSTVAWGSWFMGVLAGSHNEDSLKAERET